MRIFVALTTITE